MTDLATEKLPTWLASERRAARKIGRPVSRFLHIEASGGVVLLLATVIALIWANTSADTYADFWHSEITVDIAGFVLSEDLAHWVNDGLMVLFFFVVGLEIRREWEVGELVDRRAALLPALAAFGGMVVPAALFALVNMSSGQAIGWGVPMATDIAFALGVVALVGDRVPGPLKVFLLTLAIVDDIGAIVVIAIFYSESISFGWLGLAGGLLLLTYLFKRARIWYLPVYVALGVGAWVAMLESGVHATLAGVILGMITPTHALNPRLSRQQVEQPIANENLDDTTSAVQAARFIQESVPVGSRLQLALHPWTSFVIIPIFALANAGIELSGDQLGNAASSAVTIGIVLGLVVGKFVGISGAVLLANKAGMARLPAGSSLTQVYGVAAIAGIGFTVSLFIAGLAFDESAVLAEAKIGILAASLLAAGIGAAILRSAKPPVVPESQQQQEKQYE